MNELRKKFEDISGCKSINGTDIFNCKYIELLASENKKDKSKIKALQVIFRKDKSKIAEQEKEIDALKKDNLNIGKQTTKLIVTETNLIAKLQAVKEGIEEIKNGVFKKFPVYYRRMYDEQKNNYWIRNQFKKLQKQLEA